MFSLSVCEAVKKSSKLWILYSSSCWWCKCWESFEVHYVTCWQITQWFLAQVLIRCNLMCPWRTRRRDYDLTVNAYGKPVDKEKQPLSLSFLPARAMNHCCEISFLSFKCDGLQAADQRGRAEGCSPSVSLLRVAYRDFLFFSTFFFFLRQKETALLAVLSLRAVS